MRSLNIGATGMLAQQLNVEVISNNIANMNTTGFKRHRAEFQALLYQNLRRAAPASSDAAPIVPTAVHMGLGVKSRPTYRYPAQANIMQTENPPDLSIHGTASLLVTLPPATTAYPPPRTRTP